MEPKTEWWRFSGLSQRINAWKAMEKDEVLGSRTQLVLPVSTKIQDQLLRRYPKLANKHLAVAYPGVHPLRSPIEIFRNDEKRDNNFVFVGKEWKRKGLKLAIDVIEHYRLQFGNCNLDIYGPKTSDLPRSIRQHPNVTVKGWTRAIAWQDYRALIHPATNEPFGMVIPEARRRGVPVLTTKLTGSTELDFFGVSALDTAEGVEIWAKTLFELTNDRHKRKCEIKWTWKDLAIKHRDEIYPLVELG